MRLILAFLLFATAAHAQSFIEPARGSALRSNLMDAVRPHIEWELGVDVEFVIHDLRVSGNVAFANMQAQHPGGEQIDLVKIFGPETEVGDGATVQALLIKSGDMWVAVHHGLSATDAWWYWDGYCPIWADVLPEVCQ